jgi:hypothetical protein
MKCQLCLWNRRCGAGEQLDEMEGFVTLWKNKRYQRYWAVLDGQQLSYYERLDEQLQEPVNIQV